MSVVDHEVAGRECLSVVEIESKSIAKSELVAESKSVAVPESTLESKSIVESE